MITTHLALFSFFNGASDSDAVAVQRGGYVETPEERRRRLRRERRLAEKRIRRFREMGDQAVIDELRDALRGAEEPPASEAEEEAAEEVQAAIEPFREEGGIDLSALVADAARLEEVVMALSRLAVEIEIREEENEVTLLLLANA